MISNSSFTLGNWIFEFSHWWQSGLAVALVLTLPLAMLAGWRRLASRNPARALLVMILNMLAFAALLLLLTEPQREHLTRQNIILITQGSQLESMPASASDKVYIAPDALQSPIDRQAMANANWLLDAGQLALREPALSNIDLYGYGLNRPQWQNIPDDVQVNFIAPALIGFIQMRWPRTLIMGQSMTISGIYSARNPDSITDIRIIDPAGKTSAEVRVRNGQPFALVIRPKSQGNTLYRLQAWDKEQLLSEQTVSVAVEADTPLQVLVRQSAPSYETRQLKDFAASFGGEVLMNTDISKGKAIKQTVNLDNAVDSLFSPTSLAASDWLIMDGRALMELPETQRQWLTDAVQSGLGLLLLADQSLLDNFANRPADLLQGFSLTADAGLDEEVIPQLAGVAGPANELALPALSMQLGTSPGHPPLNTLVADINGRILVASDSIGLGNVAIGLIGQSYRWVTAGHRKSWSDYWAAMSTALSRRAHSDYLIAPADAEFVRINQRTQVCALSEQQDVSIRITANQLPSVTQNITTNETAQSSDLQSTELSLMTDAMGSNRKCAWYWPNASGWHHMQLLSTETSEVLDHQFQYVWSNGDWPAQDQFERMQATMDKIALSETSNPPDQSAKSVTEGLNTLWLWWLFILAASALWLERKLDWNAA